MAPLDVDGAMDLATVGDDEHSLGRFHKATAMLLAWPYIVLGPHALLWAPAPHNHLAAPGQHDGCPYARETLGLHFSRSAVIEWSLVCEKERQATMISSIFFFGYMFGTTLLGWASDRLGRSRSFLISAVLLQISALTCALSPSPICFAVGRFIGGFGAGGAGINANVWSTELLGKQRSVLILTSNAAFALGMCSLSALAWLLPTWREQCWALFALGLPNFFIAMTVPEAPKWLYAAGRTEEARNTIRRIAEWNGSSVAAATMGTEGMDKGEEVQQRGADEQIPMRALCFGTLRFRIFATATSWFVSSLCYYGLALNAGALGSNIYLVNATGALVEVPAYYIMYKLVDDPRVGRRAMTVFTLILATLACLAGHKFSHEKAERGTADVVGQELMFVAMLGRFSIAAAFAVLHLWGAELFPTAIRSAALGIQSMLARVAGVSAPFLLAYARSPMVCLGVPALLGAVLCSMLPETSGKAMPDSLEDVERQDEGAEWSYLVPPSMRVRKTNEAKSAAYT
eukprot:TRINITY_DN44912_c0_g1_i1.p1 TRINITY_DN44912_c0_g1~~TRINITY_DN44912_c0_g1_i1.p1  ORF type:complete len:515 (-),score=97.41 TRINITY_DN44912_c0_g1_i1:144-1688(-)